MIQSSIYTKNPTNPRNSTNFFHVTWSKSNNLLHWSMTILYERIEPLSVAEQEGIDYDGNRTFNRKDVIRCCEEIRYGR